MNGLQRATERAEREGLLTWTRDGTDQSEHAMARARPAADVSEGRAVRYCRRRTGGTCSGPPNDRSAARWSAATQPGSFAADQYRFLQTRLEGLESSGRVQTLLVTSPGSGDGKTTTSANLALTMARELPQKVVLVEGRPASPVPRGPVRRAGRIPV